MKKKRADEILVDLGLVETRSKAQAQILAGLVSFRPLGEKNYRKVDKAGHALATEGLEFHIENPHLADVGRGAQKLRHAFLTWPLNVEGNQALDIGSSTGGFTQVLLDRGAKQVVALDVGTHQLHEKLRRDSRVVSLEKQHVLKIPEGFWVEKGVDLPFDVFVTDLSFISVTRVLPVAKQWLKRGGNWILLLKPQFELGPQKAPGGIVKNPDYHEEAVDLLREAVRQENDLEWKDIIESPIRGGDGNKEFLVWLQKKV